MNETKTLAMALVMAASAGFGQAYADRDNRYDFASNHGYGAEDRNVQLGPRPFYLVEGMEEGELKDRLMQCQEGPFYRTDFSIGHRGAALQFPEHTKESCEAGASQGAGIVECDVTFTSDGKLVCRHSDCDLHATTNILTSDLIDRCERPWGSDGGWDGPFDPSDPDVGPKCCT
jgi:glycerophosphoryl diester phosphodiesterase